MKRKRFSVEQITAVLQQVGARMPVGDVCRQVGISEQTFYATRSSVYFTSRKYPLTALRQRMREAGADAPPVRLPAAAGAVVARRLGGGQRAILSRVHRGRARAASQTPVAARHRRASRAAAASDGAQRHWSTDPQTPRRSGPKKPGLSRRHALRLQLVRKTAGTSIHLTDFTFGVGEADVYRTSCNGWATLLS